MEEGPGRTETPRPCHLHRPGSTPHHTSYTHRKTERSQWQSQSQFHSQPQTVKCRDEKGNPGTCCQRIPPQTTWRRMTSRGSWLVARGSLLKAKGSGASSPALFGASSKGKLHQPLPQPFFHSADVFFSLAFGEPCNNCYSEYLQGCRGPACSACLWQWEWGVGSGTTLNVFLPTFSTLIFT